LIPRGVLQVAQWEPFPEIPDGLSGRRELAEWIADARNPLTSRVMVNRVWHWLIGRGLVSTVDNFGSMGETPSHAQLLDHLASSFIEQGWSIKQLIREIVLSRVYRLSSTEVASSQRVDPENELLWRMNRKRLRAEDMRDSLLLVSGTIDLAYGGENITEGTKNEYGYEFDSTRRSVYLPVFRNNLPEMFEVFDFADPNIQRGQRTSSTIASQALLLMNHPRVIEQSQQAAKNLLSEPTDTAELIHQVYLQVLGRPPSPEEQTVAVDLVAPGGQNGLEPSNRDTRHGDSRHGDSKNWAMLYQVLFQCIDFRYLD
jgi:hypothetical protein